MRAAFTRRARRRGQQGQGGFVLIASLVVMIIVGLLVAVLVSLTASTTIYQRGRQDRAERARVADSALEQSVTQIGSAYLGSQQPGLPEATRLALEYQEGQVGKLGSTCGPYEYVLDGRDVRVRCDPEYTPGAGNVQPADDAVCPGGQISVGGGYCRPETSPGFLRRVRLTVSVSDKNGANLRIHGIARITIVDLDPYTGKRRNGYSVSVEQWTLCNLPTTTTECSGTP